MTAGELVRFRTHRSPGGTREWRRQPRFAERSLLSWKWDAWESARFALEGQHTPRGFVMATDRKSWAKQAVHAGQLTSQGPETGKISSNAREPLKNGMFSQRQLTPGR